MRDLAEMSLAIRNIGGLKFLAQTRKHELIFDQPKEEGGEDRGMTSVELFIASLGACIGTYIVWFCQSHKIATDGMRIDVSWASGERPNRISWIRANVRLPVKVPKRIRPALVRTAKHCTIHNTLIHSPEVIISLT